MVPGCFPTRRFPTRRFPTRCFPTSDFSLPRHFPTRHFPTSDFSLLQTFPYQDFSLLQTFPYQDFSLLHMFSYRDISLQRHFPIKTFPFKAFSYIQNLIILLVFYIVLTIWTISYYIDYNILSSQLLSPIKSSITVYSIFRILTRSEKVTDRNTYTRTDRYADMMFLTNLWIRSKPDLNMKIECGRWIIPSRSLLLEQLSLKIIVSNCDEWTHHLI